MSNGVTCAGCAFYLANQSSPGVGWCRAAPPIATLTSLPQYASRVQWPQVGAGEWCGDYATVFPPPPAVLTHLGAAAQQLIKTGPGQVLSISITHGAGATLIVYDGLDATGAVMANIDTNQVYYSFGPAPWPFKTGLFVVLNQAAGVTIVSQ